MATVLVTKREAQPSRLVISNFVSTASTVGVEVPHPFTFLVSPPATADTMPSPLLSLSGEERSSKKRKIADAQSPRFVSRSSVSPEMSLFSSSLKAAPGSGPSVYGLSKVVKNVRCPEGIMRLVPAGVRLIEKKVKEKTSYEKGFRRKRIKLPKSSVLATNADKFPVKVRKGEILNGEIDVKGRQNSYAAAFKGDPLDIRISTPPTIMNTKGRPRIWGRLTRQERSLCQGIEFAILQACSKAAIKGEPQRSVPGGRGAEAIRQTRPREVRNDLLRFYSEHIPPISFRVYNRSLLKKLQPNYGTVVAALYYCAKFTHLVKIELDAYCVHRVWCTAYGVAFKFWEDGITTGKSVANAAGLAVAEYTSMELFMIKTLGYNLLIDAAAEEGMRKQIEKFTEEVAQKRQKGTVDACGRPIPAHTKSLRKSDMLADRPFEEM
mmetsp:Transcript_34986/g.90632  ORF Transcript_34986/g.90632 Transcript_34986/m.90632 type:complete len:436 (-) Transcript_34986:544-1851(-)